MIKYDMGYMEDGYIKLFKVDSILDFKTLEYLDKFTMCFNNELELKTYLNKKNILNEQLINEINIYYKYNGSYKSLPVVYSLAKKYLNSGYITNVVKQNELDKKFLKELLNFYSNSSLEYVAIPYLRDISFYINNSTNDNEIYYYSMLTDATSDLLSKTMKKNANGDKNYKGIRELGMFLYNYFDKKEIKKINLEENIPYQLTFKDIIK